MDNLNPEDPYTSEISLRNLRKLARSVAMKNKTPDVDMAILHFSRPAKKISANWMESSTGQLRKGEFKIDKKNHKWLRVQGTFLLDLPVVFGTEEVVKKGLLQEKVDSALAPLEKCVQDAEMVLDGSFRKNSEYLNLDYQDKAVSSGKTGSKGKKGKRGATKLEDESDDDSEDGDHEGPKTFIVEIIMSTDSLLEDGDCQVRNFCLIS